MKFKNHRLQPEKISSNKAKTDYPRLVMEFLEPKIEWYQQVQPGSDVNFDSDVPDELPLAVTCNIQFS